MTRVWKNSQQSGTALLILLALADWADDFGYCYPGHTAIARKARTTERNVYLILNRLAEMGEIRIVRKGAGGKRKETSIYQVIVGMTEQEIVRSENLSPIARGVSPEKISPEKISPEKSCSPLNVLINRQLNAAVNPVNFNMQQHLIDDSPENFSPENISGEKSFAEKSHKNSLPPEIEAQLKALGWRGSLADAEKAWQDDAERVRQWLWYAGKQGMSGALLRTVLRNTGEYPPELDPNSSMSRRRYLEGSYAEFVEH
ncbi:helix-turn-helix domain-containing protein [Bellilinea sp.]|uniref:helix-turn-helix domain-containing protein n=1 Tax=Bellilinea sp. TaxID=2838785 RepID=UPI003A101163